ncbi:hypothetical protein QVD17_27442 [Tagetes erecta]|uniref:Protein kinase domain-containing protein n=1 Tax=Tagetes erecta TaxID=13708 RepID=A0AAD8K8H6_TARER|nr:hypothetical protein QVD17_27442 [Tagetes erecta]
MWGNGDPSPSFLPGEWDRGKMIGSGSFGVVHLAINKSNGSLFVVKSSDSHEGNLSIENEAKILESLNSPHIVQYLGKHSSFRENGQRKINLFIEYMAAGSLGDIMEKLGGKLDEQVIRVYTREILQGLKYLHDIGIVHGDVKCQNVLLGSCGNIKLADLGCARHPKANTGATNQKFLCGTPLWMAPEVLRNEGLDFSADIWSLGCTIIEMATNKSPWGELGSSNQMAAILKIASSNERPSFPRGFSEEGLDFLRKCLVRIPEKRSTVNELLNHRFVNGKNTNFYEHMYSPLSVLDIGLDDEDYDSEEIDESVEMKLASKIPFSVKRYEKKVKCTDNETVSQENWVTILECLTCPDLTLSSSLLSPKPHQSNFTLHHPQTPMAASSAQIHVLSGTSTHNTPKSLFFGKRLTKSISFSHHKSFLKLKNHRTTNVPLRVVAEKVVGIDLGTTNSAVGAMEGGKPIIVTNAEGQRTTPSVVAYTKNGDRLVGQIAKRQAVVNPENTFFSVKRFIGRKMSEVDEESKQVSYTVVRDENGNVKLDCPAIGKQFAAEEISAQVLRKLVDDASKFLNDKVTKAVVTVPAYFNDSQRTATKDAGRIAGLEVLRIINEPTAASLAYGFERKNNETILVFDLGGGTFDVSVLEVGDGVFEVLSTSGDTHLGGDDFDKRIVDWLAASFKKDEGIDLLKDKQALQRLTETAEKAKMELSTLTQANISLPFITATADGPKHIDTTLTRAKFEELCSDLLDRLKRPVENSLRDAKLSFKDLDEVILVGGSTRIPAVQEVVKSLTGKEPNVTVNPDEVVALGAAVQAGVLAGDVSDIVLLDVTPLSIGLETLGGVMTKIIPRNTTLPTSKSEVFSTAADGQTSVEINVLQGEREFVRDNKSLGSFRLDGIPPAPRGVPQIEVKFDIDANGILSVTAIDKGTGKKQDITITGASTLPSDEVERMVNEAEKFSKEDKEKRDAIDTKNQADSVVYQTEKQLKELGDKVPAAVKEKVEAKLGELKDAISGGSTQTIKDAMAALNQEVMQLGQSLYNQPGAPGTPPGPEPSESSDKGPEGDVIDADFTDSK